MVHTELFIEGVQLDITQDIEALFTYAVDDVRGDLGARNTSFSKTITLPGTGRNNAIFGHAFEFAGYNPYNEDLPNVGTNFNAAKAARVLVFINSIQVFKGVIRLLEVVQAGGALLYECVVFGELGGLVTAIGSKLLTGNVNAQDDLDFSAYDDDWTEAAIVSSWSVLAGGGGGIGTYWPLIDHGQVSTGKVDYSWNAMRPALYVRDYIGAIFRKSGYTYDCALFDTDYFKRLIIPHNEAEVYVKVNSLAYGARPSLTQHYIRKNIFPSTALTDRLAVDIDYPNHVLRSNFSIGAGNTQFTYTGSGAITVYFNWSIKFSNTGTLGTLHLAIKRNGADYEYKDIALASAGGSVVWSRFDKLIIATLNPSDVISFHAELNGVGSVTAPIDISINNASLWIYATAAQAVTANYGERLEINNCVPKGILQADLLSSIVKMHNLYLVEDKLKERHVVITPYPDLFDNSDPIDWSGKLDRSREIRLKPMSEVSARYFKFLYTQDGDYYNDLYQKRHAASYGDYTHDTGLDFVDQKKELKVIFAPSPLLGYVGTDKIVTPLYKLNGTTEQRTGTTIRILQAKRIPCGTWHIKDDTNSTVATLTDYGYAGHVDDPANPAGADLNFGAPAEVFWDPGTYTAPGLFSAFYSAYMAEITDKDSKLLTCYVYLTPLDIYLLSFARSIIIDGQLFRLNRVLDYDPATGDPAKAELLKVINLSY